MHRELGGSCRVQTQSHVVVDVGGDQLGLSKVKGKIGGDVD